MGPKIIDHLDLITTRVKTLNHSIMVAIKAITTAEEFRVRGFNLLKVNSSFKWAILNQVTV